jgi:hypothetical protein
VVEEQIFDRFSSISERNDEARWMGKYGLRDLFRELRNWKL